MNSAWTVDKNNILYKCAWSPFDGARFRTKVLQTFVNGHLAYNKGQFSSLRNAKRLTFDR
jgi:dihydroorotase